MIHIVLRDYYLAYLTLLKKALISINITGLFVFSWVCKNGNHGDIKRTNDEITADRKAQKIDTLKVIPTHL